MSLKLVSQNTVSFDRCRGCSSPLDSSVEVSCPINRFSPCPEMASEPEPKPEPEADICRLCLMAEGPFIGSPCHCKGTAGFIHKECLEKSMSSRGSTSCELCLTPYRVHFTLPCPVLSYFRWIVACLRSDDSHQWDAGLYTILLFILLGVTFSKLVRLISRGHWTSHRTEWFLSCLLLGFETGLILCWSHQFPKWRKKQVKVIWPQETEPLDEVSIP
jgi:hypothetical protein